MSIFGFYGTQRAERLSVGIEIATLEYVRKTMPYHSQATRLDILLCLCPVHSAKHKERLTHGA